MIEFTISRFNSLFKQNTEEARLLTIFNWAKEGMKYRGFKLALKTHREISKLHTEFKKGFE